VLTILQTDIFVATPRVLVLIPIEFEKKPVLLRPCVVVAPSVVPLASNVVIVAEPAPRVVVLKILQTDIFVATPRVLVLIPVEFEKKPVLLCPTVIKEFILAEPAPKVLVLKLPKT